MQKKLASNILVLILLLAASNLYAEKNNPNAVNSGDVISRMTKELGLNETQRSKVEAILNTEKQKVEAIFNEEKKKLQLIQEETRSSLQAVLTPEQMDKLDKKMRQGQNEKNLQKK